MFRRWILIVLIVLCGSGPRSFGCCADDVVKRRTTLAKTNNHRDEVSSFRTRSSDVIRRITETHGSKAHWYSADTTVGTAGNRKGLVSRRLAINSCPGRCTRKRWRTLTVGQKRNCRRQCNLPTKKYTATLEKGSNKRRQLQVSNETYAATLFGELVVKQENGLLQNNSGINLRRVYRFQVPCDTDLMVVWKDGFIYWVGRGGLRGCPSFQYEAIEAGTGKVYTGRVYIDAISAKKEFCNSCCLSGSIEQCPYSDDDTLPDWCDGICRICPKSCLKGATWSPDACHIFHNNPGYVAFVYDTCIPDRCPFPRQSKISCGQFETKWYKADTGAVLFADTDGSYCGTDLDGSLVCE